MSVIKNIINRFMGGRESKGEEESVTPRKNKSDSDSEESNSSNEMKKMKEKAAEGDDESRSSTSPGKVKRRKIIKTKPKPSTIQYDDTESSNDAESQSQSLITRRKRPATRLSFPSESTPKKRRSPSPESSFASNTEEEIDITESQYVVTDKKKPKKKQSAVDSSSESDQLEIEREEVDAPAFSPLSLNNFFSLDAQLVDGKDLNENNGDVVRLVVEGDIDVEDHLKAERIMKPARKRKNCLSICELIDILHSKNHPLQKFRQCFTHRSLKKLTKKDLAILKSAALALARK